MKILLRSLFNLDLFQNFFCLKKHLLFILCVFSFLKLQAQDVSATRDSFLLCYSTYISAYGTAFNDGVMKNSPDGSTYLFTTTNYTDFPVTPGAYQSANNGNDDCVLIKFDANNQVVFATYFGGPGRDRSVDMEVGPDGNVVLLINTNSLDLPMAPGSSVPNSTDQPYIAKFNPSGQLIFGTYYNGSGNLNSPSDIAIASDNSILVVGETNSVDLAITPGAYQSLFGGNTDGFIVKYNSGGSRIYSSYLGGNNEDRAIKITTDINDNVYTGLFTRSNDFPITPGAADPSLNGFLDELAIVKFDNSMNIVYATYLGGNTRETLKTIKVDNFGVLNITGGTQSVNFPTSPDAYQAIKPLTFGIGYVPFLTRLNPDGSLKYSTYFSGTGFINDIEGPGLGLNSDGSTILLGYTESTDFPVTAGAFQSSYGGGQNDMFISKFAADGTLVFSTYYGGSGTDRFIGLTDIPINADGSFLLGGYTNSVDFPVTDNSTQGSVAMLVFRPDGIPAAASRFGGSSTSNYPLDFNYAADGKIHLFNYLGQSSFNNYPLTPDAYLSDVLHPDAVSGTGYSVINITTKLDTTNNITPLVQSFCQGGPIQPLSGNRVKSGLYLPSYQWQFSDVGATGPWSTIPGAILQNYTPGTGTVNRWFRRLVINNSPINCTNDPVTDTISISNVALIQGSILTAPQVDAGVNIYSCAGESVLIGGNPTASGGGGGYSYQWDMIGALDNSTVSNPIATVSQSTIFTITVTDANGCINLDQVVVFVNRADAGPDASFCGGSSGVRIGTALTAGEPATYSWTPATGLSCTNCARPIATPLVPTQYILTKTITLPGGTTCQSQDTILVTPIAAPTQVLEDVVVCYSSTNRFEIGHSGDPGFTYTWAPGTFLETNNSPTVFFNSGSIFLDNITTNTKNPFRYLLTAVNAGCAYYDTMTVTMVRADADIDGCGPRTIGIDWHPQIDATYNWTVISGPDNLIGPRNLAVVNVGGSDTETTIYQMEVCFEGVCCTDIVVVPPCGCNVEIFSNQPNGCNAAGDSVVLTAVGTFAGFPGNVDPNDIIYTWTPCIGLDTCMGPIVKLTDNIPRLYTVTVTHPDLPGSSCSDAIEITDPSVSIPIFEAGNFTLCNPGQSAQLGQPPVAGYAYNWTGPGGFMSTSSNPIVIPPSLPALYYVTVTDIGTGCQFLDTARITANVFANSGPNQVVCPGAIIQLGVPDPSNGAWTYSWSPVASPWQNGTNENSAQPEVLVATDLTFSVTVTDPVSGCMAVDTMIVTVDTSGPVIDFPDVVVCEGNPVELGLDPIPFATYTWTPSTGLSCTDCAQPIVTPTGDITYTVTVNFSGNCPINLVDDVNVTVIVPEDFVLTPIEKCTAASVPLNSGLEGECANCTYSWTPTTGLSNPTVINPSSSVNTSTDYTLQITSPEGCIGQGNVTVNILPSGVIVLDTVTTCRNVPVALNPDLIGECVGCTYSWSPAAGLNNPTIINPTANSFSNATFTLTITDAIGCTTVGTVQLNVIAPEVLVLPNILKCAVGSEPINPQNIGACVGCTYSWNPSTGLNNNTTLNPTTTSSTQIIYTLRVNSPNGCGGNGTVLVQMPTPPMVITSTTICGSETINIGSDSNDPASTYSWTPALYLDDPTSMNPVFTPPAGAGIYDFTVVETRIVNGSPCPVTATVRITVNAVIPPPLTTEYVLCEGTCLEIGTPAVLGYSYTWQPVDGLSCTICATTQACPVGDVIYTLTILNNSTSCFVQVPVTIDVLDLPIPTLSVPDYTICYGESVLLDAQISPAGNYDFNWTPTLGLNNPFILKPTVNSNVTGVGTFDYILNVTDNATGCGNVVDTARVIVQPLEVINISIQPVLIDCDSDTLDINATITGVYDPSTIDWSSTGTGTIIPISNTSIKYVLGVDEVNGATFSIILLGAAFCGNVDSDTLELIVPQCCTLIVACPQDTLIDCGVNQDTISLGSPTIVSSCGDVTITYADSELTDGCSLLTGAKVRTFTIVDENQNIVTCTQTITVQDTIGPVFDGVLPGDITVECDDVPIAETLTATDNCSGAIVTFSEQSVEGDCTGSLTIIRTWTATDGCGNSTEHVQMIMLQDTTGPVIIFDDPIFGDIEDGDVIDIQCRALEPGWVLPTITESAVIVTDNCGEAQYTITQTVLEGTCVEDGYFKSKEVQITAVDDCGNETNLNFSIHIVDTIPPVFTVVPQDVTIACSDTTVKFEVLATDECECAIVSYTDNVIPGSCAGNYAIIRRYMAKDCCGNISTYDQTINVVDNTPPVLIAINPNIVGMENGDSLTTYCDEQGLPSWLSLPVNQLFSGVDNCSGPVKLDMKLSVSNEDACWLYGYSKLYTVNIKGSDGCGNFSNFVFYIEVIDTVAPKVISFEPFACGDKNQWPVAVDNCSDVEYKYVDSKPTGECASSGTFVRTWYLIDRCNNTTTLNQIITPNDGKGPEIVMSAGPYAGTNNGGIISIDCKDWTPINEQDALNWVSVTDVCNYFNTALSHTSKAGNCLKDGYYREETYTWTSTDFCGNSSEFKIHIRLTDTQPPSFAGNASLIQVGCINNIPPVRANDNCSAVTLTVKSERKDGDCKNTFTTMESYTATDACGNKSYFTRRVEVTDTIGPVIFNVQDMCENDKGAEVYGLDYCNNEKVKVTSVKEDKLYGCGGKGYYYIIHHTATDACGNTTEVDQKVISNDYTPPVIYYTDELLKLIYIDNSNTIHVDCENYEYFLELIRNNSGVLVTDNCQTNISPLFEQIEGSTRCTSEEIIKEYLFRWTATDVCGNKAELNLKVIMSTPNKPDFSFVPADVTVHCEELAPLPVQYPELGCGFTGLEYSSSNSGVDQNGNYTEIRTWTYTNVCNEQKSDVQIINHSNTSDLGCTILEIPEVICGSFDNEVTVVVTGGEGPYTYEWEVINGSCHIVSGQNTPTIIISISFKTLQLKVTVRDANGCVTECYLEVECTLEVPNESIVTDIDSYKTEQAVINKAKHAISATDFTMRPNPTSDMVYVEFQSTEAKIVQVRVTDQLGNMVIQRGSAAFLVIILSCCRQTNCHRACIM
ncbi:MAG: hypothetical protein IPN87_03715 [Saprospiraceae bacterium]|nr:hypothetical protein [Candidatus Brachybacter algidus]